MPAQTLRASIQPTISRNVRILMAHKDADQRDIGAVIGKSAQSVGHKLRGRADWSVDEVLELSQFGGPRWPIARFFNDPDLEEPTEKRLTTKLRAIQGEGRDSMPRSPLLTPV